MGSLVPERTRLLVEVSTGQEVEAAILGHLHHDLGSSTLPMFQWSNVITQAVVDELTGHGPALGALSWLEVVHVDGPGERASLIAWMERHGAGDHQLPGPSLREWPGSPQR